MNASNTPAIKPSNTILALILGTAFLNLAGIGIIAPVSPFLLERYVQPESLAFVNGLIFTAYSFFQFISVPGLGALSDRYGRRPVLFICLLGSAVGYLIFGLGGSLWVLFLGRIIDGITGGNIGVITAYIADITSPQERTRYYGLLGAIAGFGFVVGPALGGFLAKIGNPTTPIYFAAAMTLANVVAGYFFIPESLPVSERTAAVTPGQLNPFTQLIRIFSLPQLRWLLVAIFFVTVPFAALQANLSVLTIDFLGWKAENVAVVFTIVGLTGIFTQGWLLRVLLKTMKESSLALGGGVLMAISFVVLSLLPQFPSAGLIYGSAVLFAMGNGLLTPSLTSLLSQAVTPREQGLIQGGNQSIQALGRVVGPLLGGVVYTAIGAGAPYGIGAILFVIALGCVLLALPSIKSAAVAK